MHYYSDRGDRFPQVGRILRMRARRAGSPRATGDGARGTDFAGLQKWLTTAQRTVVYSDIQDK
jgi:hypothetical protein